MAKKTKRMFMGGMGATPKAPARSAAPVKSAPPPAIANNPAIQRMQQSIQGMQNRPQVQAQAAGRMPARQMGSVPAPTSNIGRLAAGPNPMASRAPAPTQNVARGIGRAMGMGMKKGGSVDGCANKGKTKGRMV